MSTDIVKDGPVEPAEINGLREAVRWGRSDADYSEVLRKAYTYYTVRDRHGQLIAYMSVLSDGLADAFLLDLVVHPKYRKKGIGTKSDFANNAVRLA
jgi:GNAT superfamily N-acetyltransferase